MVLGYCRGKVVPSNPEFLEDEPSNPEEDDYDEEVENTGPENTKSPPEIKSKGGIIRASARDTVQLPCEVENTSEFYKAHIIGNALFHSSDCSWRCASANIRTPLCTNLALQAYAFLLTWATGCFITLYCSYLVGSLLRSPF